MLGVHLGKASKEYTSLDPIYCPNTSASRVLWRPRKGHPIDGLKEGVGGVPDWLSHGACDFDLGVVGFNTMLGIEIT